MGKLPSSDTSGKNKRPNEDRQLANRYALASVDMEEAIAYLDCYQRLSPFGSEFLWENSRSALLSAAIVAYCRPFKRNNSAEYAIPKLRSDLLISSVRERQVLHDLLIGKRDAFIAHADWTARSVEIAVNENGTLQVDFSKPNLLEGLDVKEFQVLADEVRQDCVTLTSVIRRSNGPTNEK